MNRLERISAILIRLQSRSIVTAAQLADQYGITIRTVYRDIRVLEEAGIPIVSSAGRGYSLVDGFKLPPLMFTPDEAIAFLMAEKLTAKQTDGDISRYYRSGMDKIRAVMRNSEKEALDQIDNSIVVHRVTHKLPTPSLLQPLLNAIMHHKAVQMEYRANYSGEQTQRTIEPLGICHMNENWYLLAHCLLRNDYRTFHIGRISRFTPTDRDFSRTHPSLQTLLDRFETESEPCRIVIRVERAAMKEIAETKYLFGWYEEQETDNGVEQYYMSYSPECFARWFLSFVDKATIIDPPELKDTARQLIGKIKI